MGMANNAYAEIISRMLDRGRRNHLLLNQEAVGAVLTVAATLLILPLVSGRDPVEGRIDVLWLGAAAMAAACVAATIVGPTTSGTLRPPTRFVDDYREGVTVVRTRSWYRLFLATQIVFVPIGLSMTFFSLRAAMAHADKAGSLHVLVISSAAGLLAGSFLWRRVFGRRGVRGMLVMSGAISSTAALVCLANEVIPDREQLWVHGVVFFLATLANAAIGAATVSWISAFATEDRRAMLISFAAALAAVVSTVLGAVLGTIAQATVAPWPVMIVLVLAVLATTVAVRAPDRPPATMSCQPSRRARITDSRWTEFVFGDEAARQQGMRQRDQLALGIGQVGVDGRRERVLLVAALLESRDVGVAGGVVERVAESVEAGLPRRDGVLDAVLRRHPRPHLVARHDLLQTTRCRIAHHSPLGCIAGRVSTMTLVVTPARGSATPIRQSRVMISVSWSSVQPSVPSGRIGMTMKRFFWFES